MFSTKTRRMAVAIAAFLLIPIITAADVDTTGWITSLVVDVTTTQTSYSDSWVGGEAGSLNWVSNLNGSARKQLKTWLALESTLRLSFGQTLTQDADTKDWSKPRKSTDLIDWETVGRFTLHGYVDPYAAFRIESQFYDGSVEAKKRFFSPLRFTESAGVSRLFYEQDKNRVTSRLGLGIRQIFKTAIVGDTADLMTDDSTLIDGGFESVTDASLSLRENLLYTAKLSLFKAFYFSKSDEVKGTPAEDNWKAIDVNWENTVSAAISKLITVNLYTQLLYDKEISRKGRIKETLAIGLVYRMM